MENALDLYNLSISELQQHLKQTEASFAPVAKQSGRDSEEWQKIAAEARTIRCRLHELTGDWYGRAKVKTTPPDSDLLSASYDSPDDVPPEVLEWVRKSSILNTDATDAVRWARIIDTQEDDRYPEGDITVFRAIEKGSHMVDEIRPGDWVTTDETYAEDHLRRWLGGKGQILSMTVDGRDVLVSPTGNDEEAIYAPFELSAELAPRRSAHMRKA